MNHCVNALQELKLLKTGQPYCHSVYDGFVCWPPTAPGTFVTANCPDTNMTDPDKITVKTCFESAQWGRAQYELCLRDGYQEYEYEVVKSVPEEPKMEAPLLVMFIYFVNYPLTTLILCVAMYIFFYFENLKCLRNFLHCNLMLALILNNLSWLILHVSTVSHASKGYWLCRLLITITRYYHSSIFYWMFAEGLFLLVIIVNTYSVEKLHGRYFLVIGWCGPLIPVSLWAAARFRYDNSQCWILKYTYLNFIISGPILLLLLCNMIFLAVIIRKTTALQSPSPTLQLARLKRSAKATVTLVPLLGTFYLLFLFPPKAGTTVFRVYVVANAILQSSQGSAVALIYCFLNSEVQDCVKQKFYTLLSAREISLQNKTLSQLTNQQ